jgi:hypothetical protein
MPKPGESLSAQDLQVLEDSAQVEEPEAEDIDIDQWLSEQAQAGDAIGHVIVAGPDGKSRRLKIAAITEGEENKLLKGSKRPDPKNPREMRVDPLIYRRNYVAFSLLKAHHGRTPDDAELAVRREALVRLAPGALTKVQNAIQELSQYERPQQERVDPFSFLT